jgi:hypothetical protein
MASILVLPGLLSFFLSSSSRAIKVGALVLVTIASTLFVARAGDWIEPFAKDRFVRLERSTIARAGFAHAGRELEDVVSIIQARTAQDEAIYAGVKNHDQFTINDVILPFLADRPYATRYHELHPGVTTTSRVQQEIVLEFKNAPARLIVLRPGYWPEPNETRVDEKVDLLDRYIVENYDLVDKVGGYELWLSKVRVK